MGYRQTVSPQKLMLAVIMRIFSAGCVGEVRRVGGPPRHRQEAAVPGVGSAATISAGVGELARDSIDEHIDRWIRFGKALGARNQKCCDLGNWKQGSKLGSECSIPEPLPPPHKPQD